MKYILKRTAAYFIDCAIAFSIVMLVFQYGMMRPIRKLLGIGEEWFHSSINMEIYVLLSISLPVWLYFSILDSSEKKGTFGKRILKLSVVKKITNNKLGFKKSFLRTACKLLPWEIAHLGIIFPIPLNYAEDPSIRVLSILGMVLFMIYFLSILWDKEKQSIYDKLMRTIVVDNTLPQSS